MVSANQTRVAAVLAGKYQLRVPLYQRRYAWKRDAWTALWDDVLHLALDRKRDSGERHFLGSVVLAPTPNGAARYATGDRRPAAAPDDQLAPLRVTRRRARGYQRLCVPVIDRCLLVASETGRTTETPQVAADTVRPERVLPSRAPPGTRTRTRGVEGLRLLSEATGVDAAGRGRERRRVTRPSGASRADRPRVRLGGR